jgi:hypothetical protein
VKIQADGRKLKTEDSEREIPLLGVALAAMKLQPKGFPRYRDKSASLSAHRIDRMILRRTKAVYAQKLVDRRVTASRIGSWQWKLPTA